MLVFNAYLEENIKRFFKSGRVKITLGKTTFKGLTKSFLIIDDLEWLFRFKPSFAMIFPDFKALSKDKDKTNVEIVYPKKAQEVLNFNTQYTGSAYLSTYYFGEPKENRMFDWYFRMFEVGFKLSEFKGLEDTPMKLTKDTELHISSKDYEHPTFVNGETKDFSVYARVERNN